MPRATKTCLDCPTQFPAAGLKVRCTLCQRARQNSAEAKNKRQANSAVRGAIVTGTLTRRACERISPWGGTCGRTPAYAHHEDYSRPLDVVWLCGWCHGLRHSELKKSPIPPLVIARPGLPQPDRDW